jgi:23S rRNA pseudouridine2457 synthase
MSVDRYFMIYKPAQMLSQFITTYPHRTLHGLGFDFPEGTFALGRLDFESEGLLLLTTEKSLKRKLFHPDHPHSRDYLVQVSGLVSEATVKKLSGGITIILKKRGEYLTRPCVVELAGSHRFSKDEPENRAPRTWLRFVLYEGKNRQIRKMCRTVHHRCVRLIRIRIADLDLGDLRPGEVREVSREEMYRGLALKNTL